MIRLSRSGWNNVIIIAMLLMILVFNSSQKMFWQGSGEQSAQVQLLPAANPVMTLEMGDYQIERIGRGWRVLPALEQPETQLAELVERWQSLLASPVDELPTGPPLVVVVWLAGENNGRVFQLFEHPEGSLIKTPSQVLLSDIPVSQLVLPGVL